MKSLLSWLALASALAIPSSALDVHLASPPSTDLPNVALTLTAERIGGREQVEPTPPTVRDLPAGTESLALDLADDSVWRLRIAGPEIWSPEVLVDLLGEQDPNSVELTVFPTIPVRFTPRLPGDAELPEDDIVLSFAPVSDEAPPSGHLPCERIEEGALSCPAPHVPSTRSDLKLRIPGYASHFVWGREIPRDGLDLGTIRFIEGASVIGRIEIEAGDPLPDGVTVTTRSAGLEAPDGAPDAGRETLRGEAVPVDDDGFFHLRGLAAGNLRLQVTAEGFAPLRTEAFVLEAGSEATLPDPLMLQRPIELGVRVAPPVDRAGEAWRLSLMHLVAGRAELLDRGRTTSGTWRAKPLPAGQYQLMVMDSRGTRVAIEAVDLNPGVRELVVELDAVEVEGVVLLGDEPLPRARVYFGGRAGMVSVRVETDDEGRFNGVLPKSGEWPVQIEAFGPSVARRLEGVEVEPSGDGRAFVELELPATVMSGEVVDEEGQPVADAHVVLGSDQQRPVQTVTDDDGAFELHGLESGWYQVSALRIRPEGTEQAPGEQVELDETNETRVRLVLHRQRRVDGTVTAGGRPAGGVVIRYQSPESPFVTGPVPSGPDGRFELEVPASVRQLTVTAMLPGSQLFQQTFPLGETGDLAVELSPGPGGTLILPAADASADRHRFVTRDGHVRLDLGTLRDWAGLNGARDIPGDAVRIPGLPAGLYQLCNVPSDECSEGFLPPGGELILDSPTLSEFQQKE